jgi:DNA-binding transcriptional MerR regulator
MGKYNIQIASNLSGVGTHTLRAWEKRYQAIVPERSDSGRRLYSDEDIEKLQLLSELCTLGNSIGAIANKPKTELKNILIKLGKKDFSSPQTLSLEENPQRSKEALNSLLFALNHFKLDILSHEVGKLKITLSAKDFALNILFPLVSKLNERVENESLSKAQGNALSSILKFHMGHIIFKSYEQKFKNPNKITISTVDGDGQYFCSMLSALLCSHYNLNFFYLGKGAPNNTLVEASKSLDANIILLTYHTEDSMTLSSFELGLKEICKKIGTNQEIVVLSNIEGLNLSDDRITIVKTISELDSKLKTFS